LLIGGPPCQAYSLVGRSKIIGEKGIKEYEADHRHFLYKEYLRIIAFHRPSVFVMENVKGLLSAKVNNDNMISRILRDLQHPLEAYFGPSNAHRRHGQLSYRLVSLTVPSNNLFGEIKPCDFIVRAEDYGIPQARHRIIILGVADEAVKPRLLERQTEVAIEDVIGDLHRLRSGLSKEIDSPKRWRDTLLEIRNTNWLYDTKVDNNLRREILAQLREVDGDLDRGAEWMPRRRRVLRAHHEWFIDERLDGVCNHATRSHIRKDLHRYFFVSAFARVHGHSPLLNDFPIALLPNHKNVAAALKEAKFNDRFRVQTAGQPSTTVTSHISKDGHYFIHYDPSQCRSLTVREAARLQTFPDNYYFEGPRTQQYQQVGNAVPPLLAKQIAEIIADLFR
jgi:DNA (cytosine-5)-methyltransferase 1